MLFLKDFLWGAATASYQFERRWFRTIFSGLITICVGLLNTMLRPALEYSHPTQNLPKEMGREVYPQSMTDTLLRIYNDY